MTIGLCKKLLVWVLAVVWPLLSIAAEGRPRVADPRLAIDLFVAEPELVTPTGIAVDGRGRVLAIESHTHFRPAGYQGPRADRIRLFVDRDRDGRPEKIDTFFEGTQATMNLAIYRDGSVFVATRSQVLRLRDLDDDGRADLCQPLVTLKTKGFYPHNGLSGFAFDVRGQVYFGCGENLGADYRLVGSDGTTITGGGEGGNIFRCDPDGSHLMRLATGFWNPFHLCLDLFGRLLVVDNDPDARPPCRLLHVVADGDYGYRFRNGRRGLHPFTAWNGELPGTLPMAAGTGEAPSGIVPYEADALPDEYRGQLLVTSWGDHRIEAYRLVERGASVRGEMTTIVSGGENFRPVGIALAPDGSLYISDWVDKSYELHGKGRIWHLHAKDRSRQNRPPARSQPWHEPLERAAAIGLSAAMKNPFAPDQPTGIPLRAALYQRMSQLNPTSVDWLMTLATEKEPRLRALLIEQSAKPLILPGSAQFADESPIVQAAALRCPPGTSDPEPWWQAAASPDPFIAQAARLGLKGVGAKQWRAQLEHAGPQRRLAAVLLLRDCDSPESRQEIGLVLGDPDPLIRFAAVQWVAESGLQEYRPALEELLAAGSTSRDLFEALVAALERLDGPQAAKEEQSGEQYVLKLLFDPATSAAIRRRALRAIRPDCAALTPEVLQSLADRGDPDLRREVAQTLLLGGKPGSGAILARMASNQGEPGRVRATAIAGLSSQIESERALLLQLVADDEPAVRKQAWRSLRGCTLTQPERAQLARIAQTKNAGTPDAAVDELGQRAFISRPIEATQSLETLLADLDCPADAEEGERIFFHPQGPLCYRCHQIDGRGGRIGPDLSTTGRVLDRRRLIESIVSPSKEIAPQFTLWQIERKDGTTRQGMLLSEAGDGVQLYADSKGETFRVPAAEVEVRAPLAESVMPANLPGRMTKQEFADLIAYLQSRK